MVHTALAPYMKLTMPTVVNYNEGCQPFPVGRHVKMCGHDVLFYAAQNAAADLKKTLYVHPQETLSWHFGHHTCTMSHYDSDILDPAVSQTLSLCPLLMYTRACALHARDLTSGIWEGDSVASSRSTGARYNLFLRLVGGGGGGGHVPPVPPRFLCLCYTHAKYLGGGGSWSVWGGSFPSPLPPPPQYIDRTLGCCNRINNRNYVYLLVLMQYGSY